MNETLDAVIIGSGPNGLAAGITLARAGFKVRIIEALSKAGGGLQTESLTESGFLHDHCSAVHPMGILSPFFRSLPLESFGLKWCFGEASVAHPMDEEPAVMLFKDLDKTAAELTARDGKRWKGIFKSFLKSPHNLMQDLMGPLRLRVSSPYLMARFGSMACLPASTFSRLAFHDKRARALFGGLAGHSILSFEHLFTTALGLIFALSAHMED